MGSSSSLVDSVGHVPSDARPFFYSYARGHFATGVAPAFSPSFFAPFLLYRFLTIIFCCRLPTAGQLHMNRSIVSFMGPFIILHGISADRLQILEQFNVRYLLALLPTSDRKFAHRGGDISLDHPRAPETWYPLSRPIRYLADPLGRPHLLYAPTWSPGSCPLLLPSQ